MPKPKLNKAPKIIYLQAEDYEGEDITWCQDKINDTDVKYVRASELAREREKTKYWKEEAKRYAKNSDHWRKKSKTAEQRGADGAIEFVEGPKQT